MATGVSDPHERLRDDVRLLGGILGETLRLREGTPLFEIVERVRALSQSGRGGTDRDLDALVELLRGLPVESAVPIARAFSHFLTLANIAEQHHRVRRRRSYLRDPEAAPQRGSSADGFSALQVARVAHTPPRPPRAGAGRGDPPRPAARVGELAAGGAGAHGSSHRSGAAAAGAEAQSDC